MLEDKKCENLYTHSRRVEDVAFLLAEKYGADGNKAALAGLLHDYGKLFSLVELCCTAEHNGIELDPVTLQEPALLHAPVGAWLLENELGLVDRDVLEAVRFHTTGAPEMGIVSRIVYLADFMEPERSFKGVDEVRRLALEEGRLEQALLTAVELTICHVMQRGKLLHGASVALRNWIVLTLRENDMEERNGKI